VIPKPLSKFVPAIIAAVTDIVAAVVVPGHQPEYPFRFLIFQFVMIGLALLMASPYPRVWLVACLLLIAGVVVTGFSVGLLYVPTVAVAGWVMVRRCETSDGNHPV
jgi:hypothetical protein